MPFYAVARGKTVGIFPTWDECKQHVHKFTNARYKKFDTKSEAEGFIQEHRDVNPNPSSATGPKSFTTASSSAMSTFRKPLNPTAKASVSDEPVATHRNSKYSRGPQLIPARPISTTSGTQSRSNPGNNKRKLQVTEDRVMTSKRSKVDHIFNKDVNLDIFTIDDDGYVVVYTDGACKGNGRQGAVAGIGVWFGHGHHLNISRPVEGNRRTNNTAEIQAAEKAILQAKEAGIDKLNIRTDSQFAINCITKWIDGWRRNGWKLSTGKPVINREDIEKLSAATVGVQIKWAYVKGHDGEEGNEEADKLAVAGCSTSVPLNCPVVYR